MNDIVSNIVHELKCRNLTITTVESCTGGRIASYITEIAGASDIFPGGFVVYRDYVKQRFVGVNPSTINNFDVVSEEVVIEMIKGGCVAIGSDIAFATTGYAGPTGGTPSIPVGTIWIGCGNKEHILTKCLHLTNDRLINIRVATDEALNLLYEFIISGY